MSTGHLTALASFKLEQRSAGVISALPAAKRLKA